MAVCVWLLAAYPFSLLPVRRLAEAGLIPADVAGGYAQPYAEIKKLCAYAARAVGIGGGGP